MSSLPDSTATGSVKSQRSSAAERLSAVAAMLLPRARQEAQIEAAGSGPRAKDKAAGLETALARVEVSLHRVEALAPFAQRRDSVEHRAEVDLPAREHPDHFFPHRPVVRETAVQRHRFAHERVE